MAVESKSHLVKGRTKEVEQGRKSILNTGKWRSDGFELDKNYPLSEKIWPTRENKNQTLEKEREEKIF